MHAAGQVDLGSWPRLLLAASALASGFALDRLSRRYAPVAMALVSTLSCFAIFSAVSGGPALMCAAVFYLGSGAFVVFFTSAFMLAGRASSPSGLWPSAGRVVNNVVSLAVAAPALALVTRANSLAISAVVLVVLAAIYAPVFLWLEKGAEPTVPGEPPAPAAATLADAPSAPRAPRPRPEARRLLLRFRPDRARDRGSGRADHIRLEHARSRPTTFHVQNRALPTHLVDVRSRGRRQSPGASSLLLLLAARGPGLNERKPRSRFWDICNLYV